MIGKISLINSLLCFLDDFYMPSRLDCETWEMINHEIYYCFWVRFESLATLPFFKDITKGMLINKKGETKQLIRRNKWVVQYSGVELQPYTRIYVQFSMFITRWGSLIYIILLYSYFFMGYHRKYQMLDMLWCKFAMHKGSWIMHKRRS